MFESIGTYKLRGVLQYITEHKKLMFAPARDKQCEDLLKKANGKDKRAPYFINKNGDLMFKMGLQKYDRPRVCYFEKFVKQNVVCEVILNEYSHFEYGDGYSITMTDIYLDRGRH